MTREAEQAFDALIRRLAEVRVGVYYVPRDRDPTGWLEEADVVRDVLAKTGAALGAYVTAYGGDMGIEDKLTIVGEEIADRIENAAHDWWREERVP